MYLVCARMPGESYRRRLRGLSFTDISTSPTPLVPTSLPPTTPQIRSTSRTYHWRELPQVLFFVATNKCLSQRTCACRDKTRLSSWQKYACRDKTYFCRDKTSICCDKIMFVATDTPFVRSMLVSTEVLSRQTCICRDKYFVATRLYFVPLNYVCRDKHTFVATSTLLSP